MYASCLNFKMKMNIDYLIIKMKYIYVNVSIIIFVIKSGGAVSFVWALYQFYST